MSHNKLKVTKEEKMSNYIIYDLDQYAEAEKKENGFFRKYRFKNIKEFDIGDNHFHDCIFE